MADRIQNQHVFRACTDEIPRVCQTVVDAARSCGMEEKNAWKLEVSIDEACTNIACHGYANQCDGTILVGWEQSGGSFIVTIQDEGKPFDQTIPTYPDFTTDICQRKAGGLGRHIMREFLHDMKYKRENGVNTLIITQKLADEAASAE